MSVINKLKRVPAALSLACERVWQWLPDKCEADYCKRQGVRGNENVFPSCRTKKSLLLCDYCEYVYEQEGQIMAKNGLLFDFGEEARRESHYS